MKYILFLIISFLFLTSSFSLKNQNINVKGTVIDKKTNELLTGVSIKINDNIVYTDLNGNFSTTIKKGHHNIESNYISYNKYYETLEIRKDTNIIISIHSNSDFK